MGPGGTPSARGAAPSRLFLVLPGSRGAGCARSPKRLVESRIFISVFSRRISPPRPRCDFLTACPIAPTSWPPSAAIPSWRAIPPAELEVFINEQNGDVRLRTRATGEDLGSFARAWTIPLGFHPFSFSLGAHTPRLRCGKIVVQRETWTVDSGRTRRRRFYRHLARSRHRRRTPARGATTAAARLYSPVGTGASPQRRGGPRQGHQAGLHRFRELSFPGNFSSLADQSRRTRDH